LSSDTRKRSSSELGFIHQFIPAANRSDQITLLLLHGTGGNEQDLIPLGRELIPRAAILSPRGKTNLQNLLYFEAVLLNTHTLFLI